MEGGVVFKELKTPHEMLRAMQKEEFIAIVNPYGEAIPVAGSMSNTVEALRTYVRAGGHWFETGGYSFYQALTPQKYLKYSAPYPPLFADFMHLESRNGAASIYRAAPRRAKEPWDGAKNHADIFIPGSLGCGSDAAGAYCEHSYNPYVTAGTTWSAPPLRLTIGTVVQDDLRQYAQVNRYTRPLADKISPEPLARLKNSILLYLGGPFNEKSAALELLPNPTLLHFSDYLKGGVDKEYPDHLPPHPKSGTPQEMRTFFDAAHARGHLVTPYTNPTWWCDEPKGPSFVAVGDAPLLKNIQGEARKERYNKNVGWTVTLWHPDTQRANRKTVTQFTHDYPSDILFQDQCGARTWHYDTNPASPTPYAYSEGMIAMNDEDSRIVPLGTENGWDGILNYQTLLAGLSWGIVPTEHKPAWSRLFKSTYPAHTWEIFPVALYLAHDKVIFIHHDLGQFVTNDRVLTWTLAVGYSLSYRMSARALKVPAQREWVNWLDRLQKSLCSRYAVQPLTHFQHDRTALLAAGGDPQRDSDDGTITAQYGTVRLECNLGDLPRVLGGTKLPAYGFRAQAPGLRAGVTIEGVGYIIEQQASTWDVWLFGASGVTATLPPPAQGSFTFQFDNSEALTLAASEGGLPIPPLPSSGEDDRKLYHATLSLTR